MNFTHIVAYTFDKVKKIQPVKVDSLFTPCATHYNPSDSSSRSPGWTIPKDRKFSTAKSTESIKSKFYKIKSLIGEGPKYTIRQRYDTDETKSNTQSRAGNRKKSIPGPGSYEIVDIFKNPSYSIGVRRKYKELKKEDERPEMNSKLESKVITNSIPNGKFSIEPRTNLSINKTALKYPAPGKYNIDTNLWGSHGPIYRFSNTPRGIGYSNTQESRMVRIQTPGPGAYNLKTTIGTDTPLFSFPKDKPENCKQQNSDNPEPWKYCDITYKADTSVYSISKSHRHDPTREKIKNNIPSSYLYTPNYWVSSRKITNPLWRFGTSGREYNKKFNKIPGPGHYSYSNDSLPQGPRFTMRERYNMKKSNNFPGPGNYDVINSEIISRKTTWFTFNKEERPNIYKMALKKNVPGPGKYKLKDAKCCPDFTFSKTGDTAKEGRNGTGPGSYKIPCSFDDINNMTRAGGTFDPQFKYV